MKNHDFLKENYHLKRKPSGIGKIIFPMIVCLVLSTNVIAQEIKTVTISNNNISLKELFTEIEKQSGYTFFYNNADLDVEKRISLNVTNKSVFEVLKSILPTNITAEISNKQITLIKRSDNAPQNISITVSGKVTDASGTALTGATVQVAGTTIGAITGVDGMYILNNVPGNATLKVSFIGFTAQDVAVSGKTKIDIILEEEMKAIEEVVVVGYGTQKKVDVTGAISSVKSTDLKNLSITNAASALQGKSSGVQVVNTSGAPGSASTIRIRGYSSNGNSDPLFIVDGLKVANLDYLDVDNIESMEILKDGASAAIYGAEAGNGVILVTTKKGKKGEGSMFYNGTYSFLSLARRLNVLNATDYLQYLKEMGVSTTDLNAYYFNDPSSYFNGKPADVDWQNVSFTNGYRQRHTLGFQGGNDRGTLYTSLSYMDNDGILTGSQDYYNRITGQFNGTYKIKDWFNVGITNSIEKSKIIQMSESDVVHNSTVSMIYAMDPLTPVEYQDGLAGTPLRVQSALAGGAFPMIDPATGNYYGSSYWSVNNPIASIYQTKKHTDELNVNGTLFAELTPLKGLSYTSRLGYRLYNSNNYSYSAPNWLKWDVSSNAPQLSSSKVNSVYYQWENFATYNFKIRESSFVVTTGISFIHNETDMVSASTDQLTSLNDNFLYLNYSTAAANDVVGGTTLDKAQIAYYGRLGWNYGNKYNLQVNFRADAYDAAYLDINHAWGYFPSVSGGWTISNENFMKGITGNLLSYMKLRASYGKNGSISNLGNYMYSSSLNSGGGYYFLADTPYTLITPSTYLANPLLRWEQSVQLDIGLDMRFLKDRLTFTFDFYNKNTDGMLIQSTANLTTGASLVYRNVGQVNNHGLEFDLEWKDKIGKDFTYSVKGNLATVSNKVTKYLGKGTRIEGDDVNRTGYFVTMFEEGYPVWYLRGYKCTGINQSDGTPIIEDVNKDGSITPDDKTYIGDGIPKFTYGTTISLSYKNFDFLIYGTGSYGADLMYDALSYGTPGTPPYLNQPHFLFDNRWTSTNINGTLPASLYQNLSKEWLASDALVFNDSFFKIKQIQLGYNFPSSWLKKVKVTSFRAFVSFDDFFTFTSYPGLDPEIRWNSTYNMALDGGGYPLPRSVMFGVNLSF